MTPAAWVLVGFLGGPWMWVYDVDFGSRAECLAAAPVVLAELRLAPIDGYTCMTAATLAAIMSAEGA
jgi:hypothetical protein